MRRKKLLAINFGGIGDEILFLPTLATIKRYCPDINVTLLVEPRSRSVEQVTTLVDNIITFDIKKRPLLMVDLVELLGLIKDGDYDCVVSSGGSPMVSALLFMSGIRERIGYGTSKLGSMLLTQPVPLNKNQYAGGMYHDLARGFAKSAFCEAITAPASRTAIAESLLIDEATAKLVKSISGAYVPIVDLKSNSVERMTELLRSKGLHPNKTTRGNEGSSSSESSSSGNASSTDESSSSDETSSSDESSSSGESSSSDEASTSGESSSSDEASSLGESSSSDEASSLGESSSSGRSSSTKRERIVVFHPGTSRLAVEKNIIKTWPTQSWLDLAKMAIEASTESDTIKVVLAGGPDDKDAIAEILANKGSLPIISTLGETKSLADLAALIHLADAIVCVDSAPMHVAVGLRKPVVALFGPTNPNLLIPLVKPFEFLWDERDGKRHFFDGLGVNIEPERVFDKLMATLRNS